MVVDVGLTLMEPLADVDVNVPGVMAIVVAPVACQLSVLLVPELTLAGLAVNEAIAGMAPLFDDELDEPLVPQPACPAQANKMTIAQRAHPVE